MIFRNSDIVDTVGSLERRGCILEFDTLDKSLLDTSQLATVSAFALSAFVHRSNARELLLLVLVLFPLFDARVAHIFFALGCDTLLRICLLVLLWRNSNLEL